MTQYCVFVFTECCDTEDGVYMPFESLDSATKWIFDRLVDEGKMTADGDKFQSRDGQKVFDDKEDAVGWWQSALGATEFFHAFKLKHIEEQIGKAN